MRGLYWGVLTCSLPLYRVHCIHFVVHAQDTIVKVKVKESEILSLLHAVDYGRKEHCIHCDSQVMLESDV